MKRLLIITLLGMVACSCADRGISGQQGRSRNPRMAVGRTWQWEATVTPVERTTVPDPGRYTILLSDDGRAQIRFDCNRGGGNFTIAAGKLSFGPLMSTRMACPPDSLDGPFMRDLQRVSSFFVEEDTLFLEFALDSGTMRFRPAP